VSPVRHCESLESFRPPEGRSVHLAVGMFDGVHLGHRKVIESAVQAALENGGLAGALTFWPHPSRLFRPDQPTRMILTEEQRRRQLSKLPIDFAVQQPFVEAFARIEAEDFLPYLKSKLPGLLSIHVGENWRFGRGRRGDAQALLRFASEQGMRAVVCPSVSVDGERVSSTRIREALETGDVELANRLLGHAYYSLGTAVEGKRLGRTLGFPTLNLPFEGDLAPARGVYVAKARRDGEAGDFLPGVANFGMRPTVDGRSGLLLEVHLLGERCPFDRGDRLEVAWLRFLRPERKFGSVEALRDAIAADVERARGWFAGRERGGE